jgi:hypothetical protein
MRIRCALLALLATAFESACSSPPAASKASPKAAEPARITQFYATAPNLAAGEKSLLCYGVENAKTVWLSPPRHELSAALTRCVEAAPTATTSYTLTAEGADGRSATQELTITVGPPRAHIIEVNVSSLQITRGSLVTICYRVENARSVSIDPLRFAGGAEPKGCTTDHPMKTTTYTVVVTGAGGTRDEEKVTVKVL